MRGSRRKNNWFLNLQMCSINGLLVISEEDILKTSMRSFRKFADPMSKGTQKFNFSGHSKLLGLQSLFSQVIIFLKKIIL